MAIYRKNLFNKLSFWRGQSDRKPLLLRGARQVGKSWGVKLWCESLKLKLITINFEERPQYAEIFERDLDVERIINEITLITSSSPRSENTVLFLDEIQKAPKAISALRYFYEKAPDVMVLAAGSLVEFVIEECGLPVGRVESFFIYPLTFSEFLEATGDRSLSELIDSFDRDKDVAPSALVHEKLIDKLRLYYRVGGMPKVVSRYIETKDLKTAAEEQAIIVQGYRDDFRKYARKADWVLLENIFSKMGELAGGSQIKFSQVSKEHKSTQVRRALLTLERALIIHKIRPTTAKSLPLAAHAVDSRFKISFLDIGLLHYILGFDWSRISLDAELTTIADGRFAEQFVAQELLASRSKHSMYHLHYWSRNIAGSESEVDFLVEANNQIVPLEVKSGTRGKLKSLSIYCKENHPEKVFILSQRNFERVDWTLYIPLYFASRLQ